MNKKLNMAVAGAVMAFGASAANAGITIPAGDWTIDIGGNVNAYYTHTSYDDALDTAAGPGSEDSNSIGTGLLPAALGVGGKTRQNDLDIAFQFTFFTGTDSTGANLGAQGGSANVFGQNGADSNSLNIRQAYMTFGDKSWGTIKMGRDLGIFGSDAILSDMTLLGVGTGGGGAGNSTLGRIGSGYLYADWIGQISYTSPNWNGFSFAVGLRQPWGQSDNESLGYDGKVSYEWAGDYAGKVWAGFIRQDNVDQPFLTVSPNAAGVEEDAHAWEIGGKINLAGFGLVGYYYDGQGMGGNVVASANLPTSGLGINNSDADVEGGYVQATYALPGIGTKLGASWGISKVDDNGAVGTDEFENESWIIGAYHPLTKSLNLVAEYTDTDFENIGLASGVDGEAKTIALGAILFF
jgi:predicted porin